MFGRKEKEPEPFPTFSFGAPPAQEKESAPSPTFSFGAPPAQEKEPVQFSFGGPPAREKEPAQFSFGEQRSTQREVEKPRFSFPSFGEQPGTQRKVEKPEPPLRLEIEDGRGKVRKWLEDNKFEELLNFLKSEKEPERGLETGRIPVTGWGNLSCKIQESSGLTKTLKTKLDQTERDLKAINEKIKELNEQKTKLTNYQNDIASEIRLNEEMSKLKEVEGRISLLANMESKLVKNITTKLQEENFVEMLEFQESSTLFSLLQMDHLFAKFNKNEVVGTIETLSMAPIPALQAHLGYTNAEAVEMAFKMKLLLNRELSVNDHMKKCSICATNNISRLLEEYGIADSKERSSIVASLKAWKAYFLVTINPVNAAFDLALSPHLAAKFLKVMTLMQKIHRWNIASDS